MGCYGSGFLVENSYIIRPNLDTIIEWPFRQVAFSRIYKQWFFLLNILYKSIRYIESFEIFPVQRVGASSSTGNMRLEKTV